MLCFHMWCFCFICYSFSPVRNCFGKPICNKAVFKYLNKCFVFGVWQFGSWRTHSRGRYPRRPFLVGEINSRIPAWDSPLLHRGEYTHHCSTSDGLQGQAVSRVRMNEYTLPVPKNDFGDELVNYHDWSNTFWAWETIYIQSSICKV